MAVPPETATSRLTRLLAMVPWLVNRQGIDLAQAAEGLGVSAEQLETDLELLFLCGYGQMPDELIDADWEGGKVFVSNAETISRPLRLGVDEAVTLIVGLRALLDAPGLVERGAIERALAKLEAAAGSAAEAANRVRASIDEVDASNLGEARRAVEDRRRIHLGYLVPGRDETTERDVDPMRVLNLDGHWYLEGWCHRAQATRLFRMDRIETLDVLDADGTPPEDANPRNVDDGIFQPGIDDLTVTLRLRPGATWVSDYYPVESLEVEADGVQVVTIRTADTSWLRRLLWRLGDRAEVLDPPELVVDVAEGAREALTAYTKVGRTGEYGETDGPGG